MTILLELNPSTQPGRPRERSRGARPRRKTQNLLKFGTINSVRWSNRARCDDTSFVDPGTNGYSENLFVQKGITGLVAVGCLGLLGLGALAWRPAIAPIPPPAPDSFAPELVAKGETLAGGGYCAECHTAKGGQTFAGGYPMATPFGVLYSTNITPDRETGIGTWSEAAFARAMREGIAQTARISFPDSPTIISASSPTTTSRRSMRTS